MKQRVLSAIVALPVVIGAIYMGGIYLYLMAIFATFVGIYEFNRAFGYGKKTLLQNITLISTLIYIIFFYIGRQDYAGTVLGIMFMTELAVYVLLYPKVELRQVFINGIAFLYIPYMLMHILSIREGLPHGKVLIWLVILISFGSDTFAYFSGTLFGKHKLAPILSPKKTIEGAIGGVVGSILICVFFGFFLEMQGYLNLPKAAYFSLGLLGFLGSVFSQIGDLVGSAIKREAGIKDFSNLIPGHGGILDRLDSILFVAPFVYYFVLLLYRWN